MTPKLNPKNRIAFTQLVGLTWLKNSQTSGISKKSPGPNPPRAVDSSLEFWTLPGHLKCDVWNNFLFLMVDRQWDIRIYRIYLLLARRNFCCDLNGFISCRNLDDLLPQKNLRGRLWKLRAKFVSSAQQCSFGVLEPSEVDMNDHFHVEHVWTMNRLILNDLVLTQLLERMLGRVWCTAAKSGTTLHQFEQRAAEIRKLNVGLDIQQEIFCFSWESPGGCELVYSCLFLSFFEPWNMPGGNGAWPF